MVVCCFGAWEHKHGELSLGEPLWAKEHPPNPPICISCIICCRFVAKLGPTLWDLWTVACEVPLSMKFPRQEYWTVFSFPSPRDLPDSGIKPVSPALAGRFFITESREKPLLYCYQILLMIGDYKWLIIIPLDRTMAENLLWGDL